MSRSFPNTNTRPNLSAIVGFEERLHEWGFIPGARGSLPVPDDPVAQALDARSKHEKDVIRMDSVGQGLYQRDKHKKGIVRMDPDCAVCHVPATHCCDCEAKSLEAAAMEAEHGKMGSV